MLGVGISRDLIVKEVLHSCFGKQLALFELLCGLYKLVLRNHHR